MKIRDRERVEPPHVSVMMKTKTWRFGLRESDFLDERPDPGDVPDGLVDHIVKNRKAYAEAWDEMYPENPVPHASIDGPDDD